MKRKTKNLILIIIIGLLIGLIILTMFIAKSASNVNNEPMMMQNNQMQMPNDNQGQMQTPPEKPDGEIENDNNDSNSTSQTPPEMPSSNNSMGEMQMQGGMNDSSSSINTPYYIVFAIESLLLSILVIFMIQSNFNKKTIKETYSSTDKIIILILGSIIGGVLFTFGSSYITSNYLINNKDGNNNPQVQNQNSIEYTAANEITSSTEISGEKYTSSNADENAISVSGDVEVTLSDITVEKNGDSDGGDNTSFYGTNSAIIAKDGAILNIKNATISTNATGANGVFSFGGSATTQNNSSDGTTINISDSTITTSKDNSGGIMTTGGGITNASNLTITTAGTSSAAIRSDRGGGQVNVDGGTYKTTGIGSPSIYSTAEIAVKNAKLIATASEGIVIEGKNSVSIDNVTLTDTNNKLNGQSTTYKNIFLYQSMSGDADNGESVFTAKDSTIITNKGDTFYITNTTSTITLTNNEITNNDSEGNFLRAQADSWGNSGSNGGVVTLVMTKQNALGNIVIDSISTLDMSMSSSNYTGTINADNSAKSISLKLDSKSKIKLTGDSYITSLDNEDENNTNIDFNGYKLYVNGKAIN